MTSAAKHIWVAEDDEDFREMLAFVLRREGHEVVELGSGRHVLRAAEAGPLPDLLVTDHHMPELDGLDALEQMREDGHAVRAVLVTAFAEPEVRTRANRVEAVLVEKPCDIYELKRIILEQLGED